MCQVTRILGRSVGYFCDVRIFKYTCCFEPQEGAQTENTGPFPGAMFRNWASSRTHSGFWKRPRLRAGRTLYVEGSPSLLQVCGGTGRSCLPKRMLRLQGEFVKFESEFGPAGFSLDPVLQMSGRNKVTFCGSAPEGNITGCHPVADSLRSQKEQASRVEMRDLKNIT